MLHHLLALQGFIKLRASRTAWVKALTIIQLQPHHIQPSSLPLPGSGADYLMALVLISQSLSKTNVRSDPGQSPALLRVTTVKNTSLSWVIVI